MPSALRILHLEDDPLISDWIACTLLSAGLKCQIQRMELKSDFVTALQQQWDLVLIDFLLPDINGLDALYLSLQYQPSVPAIIISGELDEEVIVTFLKHGATDYVLKQRMERLLPVIQRALAESQRQCQLNNAETQITDIASNVPGAIYQFVRQPDGTYAIPWCSPAFESLMFVTAAEIQRDAKPAFARIFAEDLNKLIESIEHSSRELQRWDQEFRITDLNGEIRWLHGISTPHAHPDGSINWNGILLDITSRKNAENKARAEALLNEAVLSTVAAAVLVLDKDARIIRFNHTCETITGYSEAELSGKEVWSLLPPEQRENVKLIFARTSTKHFPNHYEGHWFTRDNQTRLLSWSNTCITDSKGMVEYIVATGIDITEKRQYEEALDEYRQDLEKRVTERTSTIEQQEVFILSILNSLSSEIIVLDKQGNITHVNNAWEQFAKANNATKSVIKGIACNYLQVCKMAIGKHSDYGHRAYNGISAVLAGTRQQFAMEYPCD